MMGETMKLIFGADPCEARENTSCFRTFPIDIGDKKKGMVLEGSMLQEISLTSCYCNLLHLGRL